jgi:hypothetical protein
MGGHCEKQNFPGVGRSDRQMKGSVQSVSLVQVLRHCMSRSIAEFAFGTHAVPIGQSVDVVQALVQYEVPESGLVSTPAQVGQPAHDEMGSPSGGVGSSPTTIASGADASPVGAAELLEQAFCPSAQSETTRPPRPQPNVFFTVITIPIS